MKDKTYHLDTSSVSRNKNGNTNSTMNCYKWKITFWKWIALIQNIVVGKSEKANRKDILCFWGIYNVWIGDAFVDLVIESTIFTKSVVFLDVFLNGSDDVC